MKCGHETLSALVRGAGHGKAILTDRRKAGMILQYRSQASELKPGSQIKEVGIPKKTDVQWLLNPSANDFAFAAVDVLRLFKRTLKRLIRM